MESELRQRYLELFLQTYKESASDRFPDLIFHFPLGGSFHALWVDVNDGDCEVLLLAPMTGGLSKTEEGQATIVRGGRPLRDPDDLVRLLAQRANVPVEAHLVLRPPFEGQEAAVRAAAEKAVDVHYEGLRAAREGERQYFVAHEFSAEKMDDLRRAIDEALAETGLTPYYADAELRQGHIFKDKIVPKIRHTRFGIYDISNPEKPNVFIELGAAIGIGKPYVIICRRGTELPSDVQGLDRIEYESYLDLTHQLKAKVASGLGGQS